MDNLSLTQATSHWKVLYPLRHNKYPQETRTIRLISTKIVSDKAQQIKVDLSDNHLFMYENLTKAQIIIDLQVKYSMHQSLPKGIPTLVSTNSGNYTRSDNIFISERLANQILTCMTEPALRPAKVDHIPIKTIINATIQTEHHKPRHNCNKTDWIKFECKLKY